MVDRLQHAPKCVYTLADSLDSVLAACEDLLKLQAFEPSALLGLELSVITHVLDARRRIKDLELSDPWLVDQSILFLTGTAALDLDHLRSARPIQPRRSQHTHVQVSDAFMIGQQLPLGFLAELATAMLDALEAHFVLYDEEPSITAQSVALAAAA